MELYDKIQAAANMLRQKIGDFQPRLGFILGTGLGKLANEVEVLAEFPYSEIPHFLRSTVVGHAGRLIFGRLYGHDVVMMAGRFHYYEGYEMQELTLPVYVLKALGIERLVISNASGGLQANFEMGDIVFVRDHINMQGANPLRGINDDRLGVRFPDMLRAYDPKINAKALEIAEKLNIRAHTGVYVGSMGPNLETPAEYEFFHRMGGDVVGMSTVPEVLVAKHAELPIFVLSVVSNKCYPISAIAETTAEDVVKAVENIEPQLSKLIKELIIFL
jgi:purine-nucleoside phosphorylase